MPGPSRERAICVSCGSYRPVKQTSRAMLSERSHAKLAPPRSAGMRARKGRCDRRATALAARYRPKGRERMAEADTVTQSGCRSVGLSGDEKDMVGQGAREQTRQGARVVPGHERDAP